MHYSENSYDQTNEMHSNHRPLVAWNVTRLCSKTNGRARVYAETGNFMSEEP